MADRTPGESISDPVSFAVPPVTQVILGVEFDGPVISEASALADFWTEIRDEFPNVDKRQHLAPMAEAFEPEPRQAEIEVLLGSAQRSQRYMFWNKTKNLVVQVQEDRFAFSWERVEEGDEYPRYRWIRERFQEIYSTFIKAADETQLSENPPVWCATTYTNEIEHPDSEDPMHGPLENILRFVCRPESDVLPPVEDTLIRQRRLLRNQDKQPCGRLYIQATPTFTGHPKVGPGYELSLRVVAKPFDPSPAGVLHRQDESRDLIVRSFRDITTDKMHQLWGLKES